jgi:hypothetical protein
MRKCGAETGTNPCWAGTVGDCPLGQTGKGNKIKVKKSDIGKVKEIWVYYPCIG